MSRLQPAQLRLRRRPPRLRSRHGCSPQRRQRPDNLLRPPDAAGDGGHPIRTGESIELCARALQRGTLVHRLLQSLPEVPRDRRRDAALKYLVRNADGWTEAERAALAGGGLALLEDRRVAAVCAPGRRDG